MTDPTDLGLRAEDLFHHTGEGRNVIPSGRGVEGHDIFYAAVQMSRMPMLLSDPHRDDTPIIFYNKAFEKLTGYERSEILGRNCRFLQGPETNQASVDRIRRAISNREDVHEDIFNYRKNGSGFWNALFISPVFSPEGELIYFFASQLDVTRRHEAEAVLQQAHRLETLGSMASGMAHEFNNLMTIVMGSLAQLEKGMAAGTRDRERLARAKWATTEAGRLTQQLLSFARREFHDNRTVDLNRLLREVDGILPQVVGPRNDFRLDLAPHEVMAEIDPGQFEIAILNLLRNAADATSAGGAITVRTRSTDGADGGLGSVEIEVEDRGTGMSAEVIRRAAEPFFTTKARGEGIGLGLSMVAGFAAQSNGRMSIRSDAAAGTTVTLSFPASSRADASSRLPGPNGP